MPGRHPTSVRFDPEVGTRLSAFVAANPGWSASSAANRLVDEGLRMEDHPGVVFRQGPAGRRAVLVGGPDVWEVVRSLRSVRAAEPDLSADEVTDQVAANAGVAHRLVRTAMRYWASYADEVDAQVAAADQAEQEGFVAWQREQDMLAG